MFPLSSLSSSHGTFDLECCGGELLDEKREMLLGGDIR